jgi:class 3 adenylate cyclase
MGEQQVASLLGVDEWLSRYDLARRAGDFIHAYDLARQALTQHPDDMRLEYRALLALVRSGAIDTAEARIAKLAADGVIDGVPDEHLASEFGGLRARLFKDRAFSEMGPERRKFFRLSAEAYQQAFERQSTRAFLAINAASMWLFAEDNDRSLNMARIALRLANSEGPYYALATIGEAQILLNDLAAARNAFAEAGRRAPGLDQIRTTRIQLKRICAAKGIDFPIDEVLPVAPVVCFITNTHLAAGAFERVEHLNQIQAALKDKFAHFAKAIVFFTLHDPFDVLAASAFLDLGAEVNLVLPSKVETCSTEFVAKFGLRFQQNLFHCLRRAHQTRVVSPEAHCNEAAVLGLTLAQMTGAALLRGQQIDAEVLALLANASSLDRVDDLVFLTEPLANVQQTAISTADPDVADTRRVARAMIFGDVKGFSKLKESDMPIFLDRVIGGVADELMPLAEAIEYAETAGDGIYLVVSDAATAARCCLALQRAVSPQQIAAAGLPDFIALRVSAHIGPVTLGYDRLAKREKFYGSEVIRTARIEPITPPGGIYVTEQFAATLYATAGSEFRCEYAGIQEMAKNYGECRMYVLRAAGPGD